MHLAVRNFLHALQPLHNRDQIRVRNLLQGVYEPKTRDPTYVDLDNRINDAKNHLHATTGHLWDVPNLDLNAMQPIEFQYLMHEIHEYLKYVRHLVGKKSRVVVNDNQ